MCTYFEELLNYVCSVEKVWSVISILADFDITYLTKINIQSLST